MTLKREVISEAVGNIGAKYVEEIDGFQAGTLPGNGSEAETVELGAQMAGQPVEMEAERPVKAEKKQSAKKRCTRRRWLPLAACICLLLVGVTSFAALRIAHPWSLRIERLPAAAGEEVSLAAVIPRWEERPIYSQYGTVEWNGTSYNSGSAEIPAERIGEFLGEVTATGWDDYAEMAGKDGKRELGAKVYGVTEISKECVIAVQYEGTDNWYAFTNHVYRPQTLGQFVEDLNLQEEVVFNTIYYSYRNPFGEYVSVRFENVEDAVIWEWLMTEAEAPNVYDETQLHLMPGKILGISTDIPLWGSKNISVSVREDGYIMTNILATGKQFYIGEEKTQGFVDYVLKECEGYETIYVYEEEGQPESGEAAIVIKWMGEKLGEIVESVSEGILEGVSGGGSGGASGDVSSGASSGAAAPSVAPGAASPSASPETASSSAAPGE